MSDDGTAEVAKAVGQVAETTGKAIDATARAGGWLAQFVNGPLAQFMGTLEDSLRVRRTANLVRLEEKFRMNIGPVGSPDLLRHLPPGFAVDLLQHASLSDEDELLDVWGRLLANTADGGRTGVEPRRSFVSLVKEMNALDAKVFEAIYSLPPLDGERKQVATHELPDKTFSTAGMKGDELPPPSPAVEFSLANLARIGVINYGTSWGGTEIYTRVNQNVMGQQLFNAIRPRQ